MASHAPLVVGVVFAGGGKPPLIPRAAFVNGSGGLFLLLEATGAAVLPGGGWVCSWQWPIWRAGVLTASCGSKQAWSGEQHGTRVAGVGRQLLRSFDCAPSALLCEAIAGSVVGRVALLLSLPTLVTYQGVTQTDRPTRTSAAPRPTIPVG